LPLSHGDLELDCVGVSGKDYVAVLVAGPGLGGPVCEIKIPVQKLQRKMEGGGLYARGGIYAGHYGICW